MQTHNSIHYILNESHTKFLTHLRAASNSLSLPTNDPLTAISYLRRHMHKAHMYWVSYIWWHAINVSHIIFRGHVHTRGETSRLGASERLKINSHAPIFTRYVLVCWLWVCGKSVLSPHLWWFCLGFAVCYVLGMSYILIYPTELRGYDKVCMWCVVLKKI